jgi:hypothetical protein
MREIVQARLRDGSVGPVPLAARECHAAARQLETVTGYGPDHRIGQCKALKTASRIRLSRSALASFLPRFEPLSSAVRPNISG